MPKSLLSSLTSKQREAIGLLQVGTFLEYFDLMLYVHMAVLLNELFFPKTDPHTSALLTAFAFCSTYILRPFGALIFGWVGDNIGRKATVILTTTMMAISCIIMANVPVYAEIGIAASWIVTLCRIAQGMSSMGEIIGAQIYVSEITEPPLQYPAVSLIAIASAFGAVAALGIASLVTHFNFNWRIAFWIGACIAVVGSMARTRLRETPEFLAQKARKVKLSYSHHPISKKTLLAFFLIYCGWPLSFYIVFMYFNPLLKTSFGYSPEDIIVHNFKLSIVFLLTFIAWAVLSFKIHPLKIIKVRGVLAGVLALFLPGIIQLCHTPTQVFILQTVLLILSLASMPTESILVKAVPVLRRFTASSFIYASSRALVYILTSFSLVYLTNYFGDYGLLIVMLPVIAGFLWGVRHFEKLEAVPSVDGKLNLNLAA